MKPVKLDPSRDWSNELGLSREELEAGLTILREFNQRLKQEKEATAAKNTREPSTHHAPPTTPK